MSNQKVTPQMLQDTIILLSNSVPLKLIAMACNVHEKSLRDNIPQEKRNDFQDFREGNSEKKIELLKLLAWVAYNPLECAHMMGTRLIMDLKEHLYFYLKIHEWELYLDGALAYKKKVECNHFTDRVDTGYRTLINSLFPQNEFIGTSREVIESILIQMHAGETPFPVSLNTKDIRDFLNSQIDRLFAPETNSKSYFFDEKFVLFFQQTRLDQFGSREQAILKSAMGIPVEESQLIPLQDLSSQRIAQLRSEVNNKLEKWKKENIFFFEKTIGDWIEIFEDQSILRGKVSESGVIQELLISALGNITEVAKSKGGILPDEFNEIMGPIRERFPEMRIIIPETQVYDKSKLDLSNIPIENIEFSVRTFNCLKHEGILTLGKIPMITREEYLQFRQFGSKSLTEVEQVLKKYNLGFGMSREEVLARIQKPLF